MARRRGSVRARPIEIAARVVDIAPQLPPLVGRHPAAAAIRIVRVAIVALPGIAAELAVHRPRAARVTTPRTARTRLGCGG